VIPATDPRTGHAPVRRPRRGPAAPGQVQALEHPELVRKLAVASLAYSLDGLPPGLVEGLEQVTPEALER
jgi:hypothetical protein